MSHDAHVTDRAIWLELIRLAGRRSALPEPGADLPANAEFREGLPEKSALQASR